MKIMDQMENMEVKSILDKTNMALGKSHFFLALKLGLLVGRREEEKKKKKSLFGSLEIPLCLSWVGKILLEMLLVGIR